MDLQAQEAIHRLTAEHGREHILVVLGAPDAESAGIAAETVVMGDPAYAGALAGVQLGLDVYHVLEEEIASQVPKEAWDHEVGLMAEVLDGDAIGDAVQAFRDAAAEGNA